jgi:hypothetical protein
MNNRITIKSLTKEYKGNGKIQNKKNDANCSCR